MRRWKIARAAALPVAPTATTRRTQHARMIAQHVLLAVALSLALACGAHLVVVSAASSQLTHDGLVHPELSKPLLEILHPTNDLVIGSTDLQIEIAIRQELHGGFEDTKLCISMDPVLIPADVVLEDGKSQLQETCFDYAVHNTTFHVEGLVPGLSYGITVGLISHARIVGISMRTFEVASITLPELANGARMSVAMALDAGAKLHNAGERLQAAAIYRNVLEKVPEHPYALHMLGLVYYQEGNPYAGLEQIERALQGNASEDSFHNSRGLCLKSMDRIEEAVQAYRRALEIRPFSFQAALNLGDALHALDKWEEAMHEFRKVAASAQDAFVKEAWNRICELVRITDGWAASEKCLAELVKRWPQEPAFLNDHGHLLLTAGQFEAALQDFESASAQGSVHGMVNVGDVLEALGETEESLQQYQLILRSISPDHGHPVTRIRIMKATVLPRILPETQALIDLHRQRFESEIDALQNDIEGLRRTDMDPARISFSTAITLNSHNRNNRVLKEKLAKLYFDLLYRYWVVRENYVFTQALTPQPYRLIRRMPFDLPAAGPRRLRVGFVSRYLFNPTASVYVSDLIPQLDHRKYETFAFAVGQASNMKTKEKFEQIADQIWVLPKDLIVARDEIRAAEVDILIFPEIGMDKTTYFLSISRLAPVQAAWWGGNADTSGARTMGYRVVSEYEHESYKEHYSEKTFQIKGMGLYHRFPEPHDYTASREQVRGAIRDRFGLPKDFRMYFSIESVLHLHPDFDYCVGQILRQDPHARIFLLGGSTRNRWRDQLVTRIYANAGAEVSQGRIFFLNDVDAKQELLLAGAADAVMASVHLTRPRATLQAFTAGVPVVTLPGELWSTRIAYGLYQQMGMNDLIATTLDEYVALLLKLARDKEFRNEMCEKIRERRGRLHEDTQAVEEWEKFLDFAGASLHPTTDEDGGEDVDTENGLSDEDIHHHPLNKDTEAAQDQPSQGTSSKDEL